jgi:hypothetical protein
MAEWQKQQKALKDAERDRKKNASSMLNNYRSGEHDKHIKDQMKQKALKDAERDNKKNASSMLNNYRGGEHDIKEQMKQKALKDAERDNKKNASSMLHDFRGGENDKHIQEKMKQKAQKDAERDNKKNASESLHNFRGGEDDKHIQEKMKQKAQKDAERDNKKNASESLHSFRAGEDDKQIKDQMNQKALKDADRDNKKIASESLHNYRAGENDVKDYEQRSIHTRTIDGNNLTPISPDAKSGVDESHAGQSRKLLSIDFSFGIIYPDDESEPDEKLFASAASSIVPHVISQWTKDSKIFCNPKKPEVIGEVATDDWYDSDDSMRYKVKGKVAVQVFAENDADEVSEGLNKVLRRRVSFRPVTEADKGTSDSIIGDGAQKWMRVRDGRLSGLGITF